jgi:hypothetical protein
MLSLLSTKMPKLTLDGFGFSMDRLEASKLSAII